MYSWKSFGEAAMRILISLAACFAGAALPACAQTPATATAPAAITPSSAPASPADANAPVDPAALKILNRMEVAGEKYRSLQADLDLAAVLPQLGDKEVRTGWVAYQRESDAEPEKIRIHLDTLQQGEGPRTKEKLDYAFDGQWASEAKYGVKQLTRWQVAAPGERVEAMRIGKGAFPPLPFGQKAADVLEYFSAATRPVEQNEPNDCDYIKLTARREHRKDVDFLTLEMWVDRETGLPRKIIGKDKDKNVKNVTLSNVQGGKKFSPDMFELKAGFGWTTNTQPLPKKEAAE